jgi:uncharacterized membrane protein
MSTRRPSTPSGEPVSSNGASASARDGAAQRLVALGYITAVAMPLVGLIVAIVVMTRTGSTYSRHARWMIVLSIIATIVWILIFTSGVINTSTNDLS